MNNLKFNNPNLQPIFSHCEDTVEETFQSWRGKPESEILDEHSRLSAQMDSIHKELGDNFDLMKTDKLGSDNAASRAEQLTKRNAELIGLENAIREMDAAREAKEAREEDGFVTGSRNQKARDLPTNDSEVMTAEAFIGKVFANVPAGQDIAHITGMGQLVTTFKTDEVMNFNNLTLSDFPDEVLRDGSIDYIGQRPLMLWNSIPKRINTDESSLKYMEQTVHTSSAKKVDEGAASSPATYTFVQRDRPLIKVAAHFKVTEELTRNNMEMEGISNTLLGDDLLRYAEDQVAGGKTSGAGATGVFGFLNEDNAQTQNNVVKTPIDAGSIDAINDAKWKCFFGARSTPNVVYLHPNWKNALENIRIDGVGYVLGSPTGDVASSVRQMTPVVTDAAGFAYGTANDVNGAVVDTSKLMIVVSPNLDYTVGFDGNDLTEGMRTVRAILYLNVRNRRPQSVVKLVQKAS